MQQKRKQTFPIIFSIILACNIANAAFIDNGDGTVTDTTTGLMWQQATAPGTMTWTQALSYCEALTFAGYDDWRLPDRKELRSIVDCNRYDPAIDTTYFPDTESHNYWSATTYANYTGGAWYMYFYSGKDYSFGDKEGNSRYARAVRSGQSRSLDHWIISSPQQASGWSIGSRLPIAWNTQDIPGDVKISISRSGGRIDTYEVITNSTPNDGQFDWTVTGPISVNCALKIEPISDPSLGNVQSLFRIGDILVDPAGLSVIEPGGTAMFKIRLGKEPTDGVAVDLYSTNPGECSVTPNSVNLTSANWKNGVEVTVTAEPDGIVDGDQITSILTGLSSSADPLYDNLNVADIIVTVENIDGGVVIDHVYPTYGQLGSDLDVKISGVNFDESTVLYMYPDGGTPADATALTLDNPTLLSATLTDPGVAGSYTLEVSDDVNSDIMVGAVSFADAATIQAQSRKKAIIVAGGGPFPDNDLWLATESLTKQAYIGLSTQAYTHDTIQYLTLNNTIDITGDGQKGVDGPATAASLENAIKTWAADNTDELIMYMVGPSRSGEFQFGSNNDPTYLSPATLDAWLDELQTTMTGPVIVIYDACQSGSFLTPLAGPNRTLIAATSPDQRAWFLDDGEISFSGIFWSGIFNLGKVYEAFREAQTMMNALQTLLIDIDGDGAPDSLPGKRSGAPRADDDIVVGRGRSVELTPPEITATAAEPNALEDGATKSTLSAGPITDTNGSGISNVWARIISPKNQYEPASKPVLVIPSYKLPDADNDGVYENAYTEFIYGGVYPVFIHAIDRKNLQSLPKTVNVVQTAGLTFEKGDLNLDGEVNLKDAMIALRCAAGQTPADAYTAFEANGDEKIGMIDCLYVLGKVAGF